MPLLGAARADACDPIMDLNADIVGDARVVSRLDAPPGGLWTFGFSSDTAVPDALRLRDVDTEDRIEGAEVVVFRGPGSIGLRVPSEAAVGTRFAIEDPMFTGIVVTVSDRPLVVDEAPRIRACRRHARYGDRAVRSLRARLFACRGAEPQNDRRHCGA